MLYTYLVYNTVVQLCQFFCCGGKATLVSIFLLNPRNFPLVHRNRYLEGIDDGQKTPCGHPDFHSYVKIQRVLYSEHLSGKHSFTLLS